MGNNTKSNSPLVTNLGTKIILGGTQIPAMDWKCTLGAYGTQAHFEVSTSIQQLRMLNYDIFTQQNNNFLFPCQIYAIINGSQQLIFSGVVDTVEALFEEDLIEISGRDRSAILRDQYEVLDQATYVGVPISNVVTSIANRFGFTPMVQQTTQLAGIKYNPSSGEEYSFSDRPRPLWHTLQTLAEEAGFMLYVTPRNELVFQQPGKGTAKWQYFWRPPVAAKQAPIPGTPQAIFELTATQQSRRCRNFTVNVFSTDRNTNQITQATSVVSSGTASSGGTAAESSNGPTYNRHLSGLTPEQAQQTADSIAADQARKNNVFKLLVEGNPTINVGDQLFIQEYYPNDLLGVTNKPCFVSSITHSFEMPEYGAETSGGFKTHLTALLDLQSGDE